VLSYEYNKTVAIKSHIIQFSDRQLSTVTVTEIVENRRAACDASPTPLHQVAQDIDGHMLRLPTVGLVYVCTCYARPLRPNTILGLQVENARFVSRALNRYLTPP
jgi:hypothetical protein